MIFANGAPAETFVDCSNRMMFQNGAEFALLYPDDDRPPWKFCLPRLEQNAAELKVIRARLLERVEALGFEQTTDPDLHLVVNGAVIQPEAVDDLAYRFALPPGANDVSLVSRSTRPSDSLVGATDGRRLGVAVDHIVLREDGLTLEARHEHPALTHGFHADEGTHRWTNGRARLPDEWLRCFAGALTLEVRLASCGLSYFASSSRTAAVTV